MYAKDNLIIAKIRKEDNSVIICSRNTCMVLALYTSSDGPSMYQVLFNSFLYVQRYATDNLNAAKKEGK